MLAYTQPEPGVLELAGPFEGQPIQVRLRRIDDFQPLLTTRGFHWINAYSLIR